MIEIAHTKHKYCIHKDSGLYCQYTQFHERKKSRNELTTLIESVLDC